jgi:hypothetical protein
VLHEWRLLSSRRRSNIALTLSQFMVNFLSYFRDLSDLLIHFDTWCPLFEEYRLLFLSSIRLQESLSTFYAAVVRCCKDIIVLARRSCKLTDPTEVFF